MSDSAENNNSQDTAVVPSSLIEDGKNRTKIHCPYCPSLMLSAGKASYVQKEFFLPHTRKITESCGQEEGDSLSDYWVVDSMYTFENVSFSLRVGSVHYLACGDCERGPIGWHDINDSSSFYIALDRVKHS